jgi:hypothetical protein
MLDLEPVNILTYNGRDNGSSVVSSMLQMYDLSGLNYRLWTPYEKGTLSSMLNNYVTYNERDQEYHLTPGNLYKLDILVFELPTTNHPIYIQQNLRIIRNYFGGCVVFVGENYKNITDPHFHQEDIYPTYHIYKKVASVSRGSLTNLKDLLKRNDWFIEDSNGDSQSYEDWEKSFIRDRKLSNLLGD